MKNFDLVFMDEIGLSDAELAYLQPAAHAALEGMDRPFELDEQGYLGLTASYKAQYTDAFKYKTVQKGDLAALIRHQMVTTLAYPQQGSLWNPLHSPKATKLNQYGDALGHSSFGAVRSSSPSGGMNYTVGTATMHQTGRALVISGCELHDRDEIRVNLYPQSIDLAQVYLTKEQYTLLVRGDQDIHIPCGVVRSLSGHTDDVPPNLIQSASAGLDLISEMEAITEPLRKATSTAKSRCEQPISKKSDYDDLIGLIDAIAVQIDDCEHDMHKVVLEGGKRANSRARSQLYADATSRFKHLGIEHKAERLLLPMTVKP